MTLRSSDLHSRSLGRAEAPQGEARDRPRVATYAQRLGGRTGYVIAGAAGLLIVVLAEIAG